MLPQPGLEGVSVPSVHSPVVRTQLHGRTWCRKLRMWSDCVSWEKRKQLGNVGEMSPQPLRRKVVWRME